MIVCICNNVNTTTIETAVEKGACSVDDIRECTGAGNNCGKCQFKINRVLQDTVPVMPIDKAAVN
jgi:bacterioferritin-associated ferredoxin